MILLLFIYDKLNSKNFVFLCPVSILKYAFEFHNLCEKTQKMPKLNKLKD